MLFGIDYAREAIWRRNQRRLAEARAEGREKGREEGFKLGYQARIAEENAGIAPARLRTGPGS